MRIAIDGRLILNHMTGISRYLLGLLFGFLEIEATPELILYLQPSLPKDHPVRQLSASQLRLVNVPIRHMSLRQHVAIQPYLSRERVDLYHYPHFDLPLLSSTPAVVTIHDLIHLTHSKFFSNFSKLKQIYMRLVIPLTLAKAKAIIVDSEYTRQELKRLFPSYRSDSWVVYLGVDDRYKPLPLAKIQLVKDKYNLSGDFILFVSERRPHKNIVRLIEAFHGLNRSDVKLVIVGKSYADYNKPEEITHQLGLTDCVRFLSNVGDDDLLALYNAARLFVLPSLFEGFGLPVLEAMACGTPVITSNQTALAEIAGDAALLINPYDTTNLAEGIGHILDNRQYAQDLTEKGFAQAAKFTWQATAKQTLAVYQHALEI